MNRAMFSGVAGMKAHQTKMDTIGNNISNVNTYGYKSQRAVFSDIYYQQLRSASAGTATRGGVAPSSVGVGSTLLAVQSMMTNSSIQNTGNGMDVAIEGEGFLQVMDSSGNIFYTRAGLLGYDSETGYLLDSNGNFVLGIQGDSATATGSQKIRLNQVNAVIPQSATVTTPINGTNFTITAQNATKAGNVTFNFVPTPSLPVGQKVKAEISNGSINIMVNQDEIFKSMEEFNDQVNAAITLANNGIPHEAGTFQIAAQPGADFGNAGLTGKQICGVNYGYDKGAIQLGKDGIFGGFKLDSVGNEFNVPAGGKVEFTMTRTPANAVTGEEETFTITAKTATGEYTAKIAKSQMTNANKVILKNNGSNTDTITLTTPPYSTVVSNCNLSADGKAWASVNTGAGDTTLAALQTYFTGANLFGGLQLTGASPAAGLPGDMGVSLTQGFVDPSADPPVPLYTLKVGKYQAQFREADCGGPLTLTDPASGNTMTFTLPSYANLTASGAAAKIPLQAWNSVAVSGTTYDEVRSFFNNNPTFGGLSIVSASTNATFGAGMNTSITQGFVQPITNPPVSEYTLKIGDYTATFGKGDCGTSIMLKNANDPTQTMTVKLPSYSELLSSSSGLSFTDKDATGVQKNYDATSSQKSKDLGLGGSGFVLGGGTEGGTVTLDELTDISIGADGSVMVTHPAEGTVTVGRICLASFANPAGLSQAGSNNFAATVNSGQPRLSIPGDSGTGSLKSNALEMSNVDLSGEFADMITTQRGFQANSRVITVSDTMLEELINLKR